MEYQCKTVPVDKLVLGPLGMQTPICDRCRTLDCSHNIEKKKISVMGITRTMRLLCRGDLSYMVVDCVGYSE